MKNYTITEEQIKELAKGNSKVKKWFPEVFETKLEVGRWYKGKHIGNSGLIFVQKYNGIDKGLTAFGFCWNSFNWRDSNSDWCENSKQYLIEATEEEVFEALKNEAVKRGFKDGAYIKNCLRNQANEYRGFNIGGSITLDRHNELWMDVCGDEDYYYCIFKDGKWAEIINILTKEEAEKKLNVKIID